MINEYLLSTHPVTDAPFPIDRTADNLFRTPAAPIRYIY